MIWTHHKRAFCVLCALAIVLAVGALHLLDRFPEWPSAVSVAAANPERRILYYRNPMGLPDTSPVPKKDSMNMDYLPVYEDEATNAGTIQIAPERVQKSGVRTEPVVMRSMTHSVRAPGLVALDDRRVSVVSTRFDAFITSVGAFTTGDAVKKGEPLMTLFGQEYLNAATLVAAGLANSNGTGGPARRLENLGVPKPVVDSIVSTHQVPKAFAWPAPRDGHILERNAVEGMMAKAGDVLFKIADLSNIWVLADVAEADVPAAIVGTPVEVRAKADPQRVFRGKIGLVYPHFNIETRTARVRIELANPDHALMPGMFADVEILSGGGAQVMAVPDSSVLDSGTRTVVLVAKGGGKFEPHPVQVGRRDGGYAEIRDGLKVGNEVVVSANFLIDAESNLKAALAGLTPPETGGTDGKVLGAGVNK